MKKSIIIFMLLMNATGIYSQNWVSIAKTAPNYTFSLPASPNIRDTLNIRYSFYQSAPMVVFHVMEFKDTPLDALNADFEDELQNNSGDTLLAIAKSIAKSSNSVITNSTVVNTFQNYKGLEVKTQYNDQYSGETILTYTRFFYNVHTLISFTVTGTQNALQQLQTNRNLFFSSIIL